MSAATRELSTDHEWLPERCPSWCQDDHARVIVECGDSPENWRDAQEHRGQGYEFMLDNVSNWSGGRLLRKGGGSYDVSARQQETSETGAYRMEAVVRLEVRSGNNGRRGDTVDLLPSEARTLAARLLRLADVMELEP